jgi:transposase
MVSLEILSIIKCCQEEDKTLSKTYKRIIAIKEKTVFDWHKRFREGNAETKVKERIGRKKKVTALKPVLASGREGCCTFSLSLMYRLNQTEFAIFM